MNDRNPYYLRRRPCFRGCVGGRKCALDLVPGHPHERCICKDPYCTCHSAAAYGLERVIVRGAAQYRRAAVEYLQVVGS